ncbi:WAP four-disulfide core domain protein 13 [Cavia porcellus]|uniref:WAP four-disulfide core domain protein 13 n=1 Tax=Cavia porcellus TaxID=10141 RepID=UPI000184D86A|nr:WAP four-disulfide core domain protein 13 [Cavia porcellus]
MTTVLFLQFLLVLSLGPQLVPGSPRQRLPKYILEPPSCRSEPESCYQLCTLQEHCPEGLECCSAFCGIVCSLNKSPKHKK